MYENASFWNSPEPYLGLWGISWVVFTWQFMLVLAILGKSWHVTVFIPHNIWVETGYLLISGTILAFAMWMLYKVEEKERAKMKRGANRANN